MSARKKAPSKKARTAEKAVAAPRASMKVATPVKGKVVKTKAAKITKAIKADKMSKTAKATSEKNVLSLPNKAINQKQSKSQIYAELAEIAKLSKTDIRNVLAAVRNMIERHVKPKGSGEFKLPELGIKVRRISKKATKAKTGRNPFTGEEIQIPAKPARKSVKVSALKTLKALIEE